MSTSISRRALRLATLGVLLASCGGPGGPVDGKAAFAHLEQIVGFGPRPFGSEALGKTADYIGGELQKLGLTMKRQELMDEKEKKLIRNLYVQIDGADPVNGPILMIGAHYDTKLTEGHATPEHNFKFVGAIDGGGGPAVLLELARVLKVRQPKPRPNVWLYWIDAEECIDFDWPPENARALIGSKAFAKWLSDEKILPRVKAFVLLDLIGDENYKIDKDGNSFAALQKMFEGAAERLGVGDRVYKFPSAEELAWHLRNNSKWGTTDDHMSFSNYGVPSVLLIDFAKRIPAHLQRLQKDQPPDVDPAYAQWWHTTEDTLDKVSPASLAFTGNLVMEAFADLENFVLNRK